MFTAWQAAACLSCQTALVIFQIGVVLLAVQEMWLKRAGKPPPKRGSGAPVARLAQRGMQRAAAPSRGLGQLQRLGLAGAAGSALRPAAAPRLTARAGRMHVAPAAALRGAPSTAAGSSRDMRVAPAQRLRQNVPRSLAALPIR